MKYTYTNNIIDFKPDVMIFFIFQDKPLREKKIREIEDYLSISFPNPFLNDFIGKEKISLSIYLNDFRIILTGLGLKEKFNPEILRKSCISGVNEAKKNNIKTIGVELIDNGIITAADSPLLQTESIALGLYTFQKYLTKDNNRKNSIREIKFFSVNGANENEINNGIRIGKIISNAVNFARDLGNEPSNVLYPDSFSMFILKRGEKCKYNVKVLKKSEITKLGMNCIIAVGKGSKNEPRFVIMKYNGAIKEKKPLVLIGKGVTFDSGGTNIKPSSGMEEMKMDMCGAAAVVGVFDAVSKLKLKVNLIGLLPLVENMPGGNAIKPSDIIKSYNGKTIEINNTDAEGRLVLADALGFAKKYKPELVIDLATLTGAAISALGSITTAVMGNSEKYLQKLISAGKDTNERIWELPLWDEYEYLIKSENADLNNIGPKGEAGTITGGKFLKKFVDGFNWIHLDIAGTAISKIKSDYIPKFATGVGVRLITRFLQNYLD